MTTTNSAGSYGGHAMKKAKLDTLQRAIKGREAGIVRQRKRIADLRRWCEEDCAKIQRNIDKAQVLLDALKRGELKP